MVNPNPLLIVISGPSGAGKDAVSQQIALSELNCHFTVTATTRPPRQYEVHGINHIFVSALRFRDMIANEELLEWAEVYGNYYGTPKDQVREALSLGEHVLLRIDVQGAMQVKQLLPDALLIWLTAPSDGVLAQRLNQRGANDQADIKRRLAAAEAEQQHASKFDYTVINRQGELEFAVQEVIQIVERESERRPPRRIDI